MGWLNCFLKNPVANDILPTKRHFSFKDTYRLRLKEWEKILHANSNQKKAGVAIFISDKIVFKLKMVKREGHYIMIKRSIINKKICWKYLCIQHHST